jgi:putative DNA primase/helicase
MSITSLLRELRAGIMSNDNNISSNGDGDDDGVPPFLAPDVNAPNLGVAVEHHSELRIAQRFVREHTGRLIYVHGVGWHWWDDTRWKPDTDGAAQRALVETIATAFRQAPDEPTQALRDQLVKDARKCESSSKFNGTLNMARNFKPVAVDPTMINANPRAPDMTAAVKSPGRG